MIRGFAIFLPLRGGIPRESGDDPSYPAWRTTNSPYSPRERG